ASCSIAYTIPGSLRRAASMATEPDPAPISHTILAGKMDSRASARARTSAWVMRPLLGRLWAKASSGFPKAPEAGGRAGGAGGPGGQIGSAGLSLEDQHVERVEFHRRDVGQLALRDALVRAAKVLADVGAEVVEPARQELAGDLGRPFFVAGKQADCLRRADA